jgi:hypothetical protein
MITKEGDGNMSDLINETLNMAFDKFKKFGFKDEQIQQLVESGKKDLEQESQKLIEVLKAPSLDFEMLNKSLHALKGLLLNMGNSDIANKLIELRNGDDSEDKIAEIKKIFNIK